MASEGRQIASTLKIQGEIVESTNIIKIYTNHYLNILLYKPGIVKTVNQHVYVDYHSMHTLWHNKQWHIFLML